MLSFVVGNADDDVKRLIAERTDRGRDIVAMVHEVPREAIDREPLRRHRADFS